MKKIIYIGILIATMLSCNSREMRFQLEAISNLADDNPDSALTLLGNYEHEKTNWSERDRMYFELVKMKAQNKIGMDIKSDSILNDVIKFFGTNGTSNEQMLTYYLLGMFHANIGEAPQAIQAYYDAIEKADTLSANCDYGTLAAIYGQMALIYHQQYSPHEEIRALKHYIHYMNKLHNKVDYIVAKSQLIRPYYLLGEKDTVLQIIDSAYKELKQLGEGRRAARLLIPTIYTYVERNELHKAQQTIAIVENESGLFDDQGNIAEGREHYYVSKGFYELAVNNLNHAEFLFRKSINAGFTSDGYKGLLSVYRRKNIPDSIMHFSLLYENAQDSLHNQMQIESTHKMSALYNYNRSQKEALQAEQKARNIRLWLVGILAIILLGLISAFKFYRDYRKKKQEEIRKMITALDTAKKEYQNIQEELQQLKEKDYNKLIVEKEIRSQELKRYLDNYINIQESSLIPDNLTDFEKCKIVNEFSRKTKSGFFKEIPSKAEWRLLEEQFSKHMPVTYNTLAKEKKLSPLELHVCILLILDFTDSSIVYLTGSISQTITNAKSRANKKVFNEKGAQTLKASLLKITKRR